MNENPCTFFEVIATNQQAIDAFYSKVFGWKSEAGGSGGLYIKFAETVPMRGLIGQAMPSYAGNYAGVLFYIQVESLEATLERVIAAGGAKMMSPTELDGYRFALFTDIEGNRVGIIEPYE